MSAESQGALINGVMIVAKRWAVQAAFFIAIWIVCLLIAGPTIIALICALMASSGRLLIVMGRNEKEDARAMEDLAAGKVPGDGVWCAARGVAVSLEPAEDTEAPLAFRFCSFDLKNRKGKGNRLEQVEECRFDGFFMRPMGVRMATGTVRLLGFPNVSGMKQRALPDELVQKARDNASVLPRFLPRAVCRAIAAAEASKGIDWTVRYGEVRGASEGKTEGWVIREGDEICVLGRRKGDVLVPARSRPSGLPAYTGNLRNLSAGVGGAGQWFETAGWVLVGITLVILLGDAAIYYIY
ncbi:hypothetical protein [Roseibium sp.]|uniref:hypothetical protein n=1 Tax=Roseibium sp. TaxID=1936156 RepID=UPI003D0D67E5